MSDVGCQQTAKTGSQRSDVGGQLSTGARRSGGQKSDLQEKRFWVVEHLAEHGSYPLALNREPGMLLGGEMIAISGEVEPGVRFAGRMR
jgi:hypothetical protein